MTIFQSLDVIPEGSTPLHAALITFAQYGIYALAFKIWLTLNYDGFSRTSKIALHITAHTSLLFMIGASYWLKSQYPFLLIISYPVTSMSVALIAEAIEASLDHPDKLTHCAVDKIDSH